MPLLFAFLLLIGLIIILAVIVYNKIIKLKVRVEEGMADIQVQLKRRHNLIGNLVETVKGYASHEKETLEKVIQARNAAQQASEQGNVGVMQSAERMLSSALSGLKINALSEAYPDLKANTNFLQLQAELTDTEDKVAASRRFYNTTVQAYNTYIQQVPGNLFKGLAKAEKAEFFELEEDSKAKEVPQVNFKADTAAAQVTTPPIPKEAPKAEEGPNDKGQGPKENTPTPTPAPAPEVKVEAAPAPAPSPAPAPTPEEKAKAPVAQPEVKIETPKEVSEEAKAEEATPAVDQEAQTSEAAVEEKKEEAPKTEETQSSETPKEEAKSEDKTE